MTALPNIGNIASDGFTTLAWLPGTTTVAASTGFDVNGDLKSWLLDVGQDTARQLPYAAYPEGWTPDSKVLILSSAWESEDGETPITITAVSGVLSGPGTATMLASSAETFPIVGVVRTA